MPSAGIDYRIDSKSMVYFHIAKLQGRGFNGLNPLEPPVQVEFGPEHVNAYELDSRASGSKTAAHHIDVFRENYNDFKLPQPHSIR